MIIRICRQIIETNTYKPAIEIYESNNFDLDFEKGIRIDSITFNPKFVYWVDISEKSETVIK